MITRPSTHFSTTPRESLTTACVDEMFRLLSEHFEGVTRDQFESDLEEKNWVVLIRDAEDLVGFSTLAVYESEFDLEPITVVYSGDTIVAPRAWGSTALAKGWITTVNQLRRQYPRGRYYWLLLTSGFRTYRFLPVFWRDFHPRHESPMSDSFRRLRDHLASERFGNHYDPRLGIVRFQRPQRLRGDLLSVPEGRVKDPHVEFFMAENPRHDLGDELVCLTELCEENLTAAGRRMVRPKADEALCPHS